MCEEEEEEEEEQRDKQRREPKETQGGSLTVKDLKDTEEVLVNYFHQVLKLKKNRKSCPALHCLLCCVTKTFLSQSPSRDRPLFLSGTPSFRRQIHTEEPLYEAGLKDLWRLKARAVLGVHTLNPGLETHPLFQAVVGLVRHLRHNHQHGCNRNGKRVKKHSMGRHGADQLPVSFRSPMKTCQETVELP